MALLARLAGVAVLALLLLAPGGPAVAHTSLGDARPADGGRVDEPLRWVTLRFTRPVEADGAAVAVTDGDGTRVDVGEPAVRGRRLRQRVRLLRSGWHTVRFRVFAQDGHPVDGRLSFAYSGPLPARAPAGARPGGATERGAAAHASPSAGDDVAAPSASGPPAGDQGRSGGAVSGPALVVSGALVAGVAAAVALRRRHS